MAPFKRKGSDGGGGGPNSASFTSNAPASGTAGSATDDFSARRSSRVAVDQYAADNDTWIEALAVCEIPVKKGYGDSKVAAASRRGNGGGLFRKFKSKNNVNDGDTVATASGTTAQGEENIAKASQRLTLRPYFQSQNSGQRVWDEPPSGASNIVYATPEARKMAEAQLEEMRSTYAQAAVQRRQEREGQKALQAEVKKNLAAAGGSRSGSGSKLLPKLFQRSNSSADADSRAESSSSLLGRNSSRSTGKIEGTLVLEDEGGRKGIPKSIMDESKEQAKERRRENRRAYKAHLEQAMLLSMGVGGGSVMGAGERRPRTSSSSHQNGSGNLPVADSGLTREEEEQLAMAKALSLSEVEAPRSFGRSGSKGSSNGDSRKENLNDGGGKMPPRRKKDNGSAEFGDRGASWELSWSRSG